MNCRSLFWAAIAALLWTPQAVAQQPTLAAREWKVLPPVLRDCIDNQLRQERGTNVDALIAQGVRPSDNRLQSMHEFCVSPAGAASVLHPSFGGPDQASTDFADWLNTTILTKPVFIKAFNQCREIVGLYQAKVLKRLQAAAASASSKSDQARLQNISNELSAKREAAAKVACIKEFVASLGIANTSSGFYADELGLLNGKLLDNRINLKEAAAAKVNDLTEQGLAQLALKAGLEQFQAEDLQADIDSVVQFGSGPGPITCLLPAEWVGVSPGGYSPCHGTLLEKKASEISDLIGK